MGYNVGCVARGQVYQYLYSDCGAAVMNLQMMRANMILGETREKMTGGTPEVRSDKS